MDYGKYIIVEYQGSEMPILFPALMEHSDIWEAISNTINVTLISAGMFDVGAEPIILGAAKMQDISVAAFDGSTTLKLKSRKEEDAVLIKKILRRTYKF